MAYYSLEPCFFHNSAEIDMNMYSLKVAPPRKMTGPGGNPLTDEAIARSGLR